MAPLRLALLVLVIGSMFSFAHAQESEQVPSVSVTGSGMTEADPDVATVSLGIMAQAKTAREAQAGANAVATKIIAAVEKLGVDRKAIQTTALTLEPIFSENRENEPRTPTVVAYRARNTVRVRLTDLAIVGPVVDVSIEAGANEVQGVDFGLVSDQEARQIALKSAVASARSKAEAIAAGLGLRLGDVLEVTEQGAGVFPGPVMAFESRSAGAPVAPGQIIVNASVTVRFALVKP
jgi:uncharacterized protein YggE